MEIFKLLGTVAINTSDAEQSLDSVTGKASSSQGKLSSAFGKIATAVTAAFSVKAIIDFGKACVDAANSAEASFAKVKTLLADDTDMEAYYKSIQQAAADTGVSVEDYSEAVYGAISASVDQADAVEFTRQAIMLSKGGFTDAATAVDVLTTAINAYGMDASDATKISDMLITTQNLGKTTVDELAASMGKIIPTAKQFGVGIDTLCGSYAVMTKNGIATAEATTYMNSMLNELGKAGTTASKTLLAKTGKSFSQLMAEGYSLTDVLEILSEAAEESGLSMADMFGSAEAGKAAAVLVDNAEDLDDSIQAMGESAGATEKAYNTMASTMSERIEKLKNKFNILKTSIGENLAPAVWWAVDKLTLLVDFMSTNLQPAIQWVKDKFQVVGNYLSTTFAPVIENVRSIFEKVQNAVQPIIDKLTEYVTSGESAADASNLLKDAVQFVADTLEIVTGWISSAIDWFNTFVLNNEELQGSIEEIWTAVSGYFTNAWTEITAMWDLVKPYFEDIWEGIKLTFSVVESVLGVYFESAWTYIQGVWDAVAGYFSTLWENIKAVFSGEEDPQTFFYNMFNAAWELIDGIWKSAVQYFTDIWTGITAVFSTEEGQAFLSGVFDAAWGTIKLVWDMAVGFFQSVWDGICKVFSISETANTISKCFTDTWDTIKGVWEGAKKWFDDTVISPIKSLFDFTFEWPHIPMPHFGITPSGWQIGDLLKGSIPTLGIDWYAKGGVMESPTVFGMNGNNAMVGGEAGAEAIAPIDTLKQYISDAVAQQNSGVEKLLEKIADKLESMEINVNNTMELDGKVIGESAYKYAKRYGRAVGV